MSRADDVKERLLAGLFAGKRAKNVELHLSRDELGEVIALAYGVGFTDGRRIAPAACEKCKTASTELRACVRHPGIITPPGAKEDVGGTFWLCPACRKAAGL